ncbi:hypothetical protein ACFLVI_03265 [Chloroflexota bacterium]
MDQALEVLKWIGLAFAAGLIGYFARYLAKVVIGKLRNNKPGASRIVEVTGEITASAGNSEDGREFKLEKKRLKLEKKKIKRSEKG